jgi:hypothetical protein
MIACSWPAASPCKAAVRVGGKISNPAIIANQERVS